ncbi:MAG: ABC transporter permease, partial [Bacteroidales bacterium]|nr:ABC transporter permease [Bacteroidales bacterium]
DIALVEKKVQTLLKKQHSIAPEDNDAMVSLNLHDYFMMFDNLFTGIKILVWIVGMGTLLAGAVGISNIMLVSIRERTGEIGIRRALGAKPQTILRQIMGESILLTCAAGYCGFLMGIIVLEGMNKIMQLSTNGIFNFNMQISFGTSLLAFSILLVAGMTAGIIPAVNALKIKAIDALRDN